MFASRWTHDLSFNHWLTNSEVVHAVADRAEGPYHFSDIALPPRGAEYWDGRMTHNPVVRRIGGKYAIYYTGTTYKEDMPTPDHPAADDSPVMADAHEHERIG
ncbi:MAG: glycosyl hydrolase family 43, partial [Verrucomicrobiota bacterium]|nr:glycosyl hydrolase family 43 [Verrucomicrobiota bacterium]